VSILDWVASELLHLGPQVNIYIYIYGERERERERERDYRRDPIWKSLMNTRYAIYCLGGQIFLLMYLYIYIYREREREREREGYTLIIYAYT